jgi:hypothetical protein
VVTPPANLFRVRRKSGTVTRYYRTRKGRDEAAAFYAWSDDATVVTEEWVRPNRRDRFPGGWACSGQHEPPAVRSHADRARLHRHRAWLYRDDETMTRAHRLVADLYDRDHTLCTTTAQMMAADLGDPDLTETTVRSWIGTAETLLTLTAKPQT